MSYDPIKPIKKNGEQDYLEGGSEKKSENTLVGIPLPPRFPFIKYTTLNRVNHNLNYLY
jgi:hypothetical protein